MACSAGLSTQLGTMPSRMAGMLSVCQSAGARQARRQPDSGSAVCCGSSHARLAGLCRLLGALQHCSHHRRESHCTSAGFPVSLVLSLHCTLHILASETTACNIASSSMHHVQLHDDEPTCRLPSCNACETVVLVLCVHFVCCICLHW